MCELQKITQLIMGRIDCDASNCVYNNDGRCNAAIVHVRGGSTADRERIRCGTYSFIRAVPHSPDGFLFEAGTDMSPPLESGNTVRIACNACKCQHFDDYCCTARDIHVQDPDFTEKHMAQCGTFIPE